MPDVLAKGTVIGGLQIGQPLGQGGFGITYLSLDQKNRRKMALKEYFPSDYAHRNADGTVRPDGDNEALFQHGLTAFISEANVLKSLPRERGLVRVRGAFEKMGTAYCAMEYIEGDPLDKMVQRLMRQHGHVPQELVQSLLDPITRALALVHDKRLIHRDIKPANIMIRRSGDPVLIDFGAAKIIDARDSGAVMYTRKYAPLEQFPRDDRAAAGSLREGPWSDLYSLSVMLYEMIARQTPPDALTRFKGVSSGAADPYVPLTRKLAGSPRYSAELLAMIDRGCALLPKHRPQSAQAFRALAPNTPSNGSSAARPEVQEFAEPASAPVRRGPVKAPSTPVSKWAVKKSSSGAKSKAVMALIVIGLAAGSVGYAMWGTL